MDQSLCEVCKVPLRRRQLDTSSFINVHSLPEEELDIAIENQGLLVPLRMQVSEYASALVPANNRPKTPTTNIVESTSQQDAERLDLLIKSHEERLRNKYQRLDELKQQRTLQRLQNNQLTVKNDLLLHLKEQTALHLAVLAEKRIQMAVHVFKMTPIVLHAPVHRGKDANNYKNISGCSSILGIPLQNNAYFEESPIEQLSTALSYIAALTDAVATVFNIPLPHPIHANAIEGPTIAPQYAENSPHLLLPATSISFREQYRSFDWTTLSQLRTLSTTAAENQRRDNENELVINPTFYQSLTLLQADIVTLCLKLGLHAGELWPAPCMLLNLYELNQYCRRKQTLFSTSPSSGAGVPMKNAGVTDSHIKVINELRQRMEISGQSDYYKASVDDVNKRLAYRFARDFSLVSHQYHHDFGLIAAEGTDEDGGFETVDHHVERREVSADGEWDLL